MEPLPLNPAQLLIGLLLKCHQVEKHLASLTQVSVEEFHCITLLHLQKPRCVRELSEHLGVKGTRTSKLLQSLERGGYIARRLSPADHRKEEVTLTPSGVQVVEKAMALSGETWTTLFGSRKEEYLRLLPELVGALSMPEIRKVLTPH